MVDEKEFILKNPVWCPGCGHYAVLTALRRAVVKNNLKPEEIVLVTGIGCSSRFTDFFRSYGFHGIHGRALPAAVGIKLANPKLKVIVASGDGDTYAIGMSHFIHTARRNIGITHIVMNNQIYGLTKGQYSPTSAKGFISSTSPKGKIEKPIDGVLLALSAGATYIARGFSGNLDQLIRLIEGGLRHKGYALIDVLSPCVTFNKLNTYEWFRKNTLDVEQINHSPSNRLEAFKIILTSSKIPIGLIYQSTEDTFEELIANSIGGAPIDANISLEENNYESLIREITNI
ncbi:MAG: 2-oxoacid:ferredoxin oxidoreductase subunit beta [Candidatus Methanomethylicia archaeon]